MPRVSSSYDSTAAIISILILSLLFVILFSSPLLGQSPPTITRFTVGSEVKEMGTVLAWVLASDPDGDTLTYTWSFESDPTGKAVFYNPLQHEFSTMLSGPQWRAVTFGVGDPGEGPPGPTDVQGKQITVQVDISDGTTTVTKTADVLVSGFNQNPVIILDTTGMGTRDNPKLHPGALSVSASESFDPDGGGSNELGWDWGIGSINGGTTCSGLPEYILFQANSDQPSMPIPRVTALPSNPMTVEFTYDILDGLYRLRGSVTGYIASPNGCGTSGGNEPPQVSIQASTSHAAWGETVNLTGVADDDPGDTHTYSWTQVGVTGIQVGLSSTTTRNTSFTAPNVDTFLRFRFTATDSAQQSDFAEIEIRVSEQGGDGGGGGHGGSNGGVGEGTSTGTVSGCGPGNQPAVATVPATYTIPEGLQGQIQATNASDPDNTVGFVLGQLIPPGAYFDWSVLDGKGLLSNGDLSGKTTNSVSFTAPAVNADTTFGLQLFAQDAVGCGTQYPIDLVVQNTDGEIIYPIWGAGPLGDGSALQTTVIIDNLSERDVEDVRIEFYNTAGDPVDLHYVDLFDPENSPKPWDSNQPFTMAALCSRVIEFVAPPGTPAGLSGWALVTSTGLLRGPTRFQLIHEEDGSLLEDVGIPNAPSGSKFLTAYRKKDEFAFAIANPTEEQIEVRVLVYDVTDPGQPAAGFLVFVPARGQVARFLSQLIQTDVEEGYLIIESDEGEDFALTGLITVDGFFISAQSISRIQ